MKECNCGASVGDRSDHESECVSIYVKPQPEEKTILHDSFGMTITPFEE